MLVNTYDNWWIGFVKLSQQIRLWVPFSNNSTNSSPVNPEESYIKIKKKKKEASQTTNKEEILETHR